VHVASCRITRMLWFYKRYLSKILIFSTVKSFNCHKRYLCCFRAFGLAGIRLGMAIAPEPIIQLMNNVKAPYNVNKLTIDIASKTFDDLSLYRANVQILLKERDFLLEELRKFPAVEKIFPSDANFLLFRIAKAQEIYKIMADRGVVCRYRGSEPHCDSCLRVTVGTHDENSKFMAILKQIARELGVN